MFRIVSLLIGYAFGNILTAEIVTRRYNGASSFELGSHNPGMANVMAQCGFRPGICVLIGDLAKTLAACLLCRFVIFSGAEGLMACAYAGLGAVLGHNFPFWHRFQGGKGVSASCAAMFCIHPLWGLLAMVIGMLVVFGTKYLSIGAAVIPVAFLPVAWWMLGVEGAVIYLAMSLLMLFAHRRDFSRIRRGEEEKIDVPDLIRKKLKKKHVDA